MHSPEPKSQKRAPWGFRRRSDVRAMVEDLRERGHNSRSIADRVEKEYGFNCYWIVRKIMAELSRKKTG